MTATVAGIHLGIDTHANRPAGNSVPDGSIYSCSTHGLVYKSNYAGNSWATWATLGGTETLPVTIIDAKGDLIAGTAADTASRLAVGSNGDVLTADSTQTTGIKWAAAGAASLSGFEEILSGTVTMTNANQFYDGPSHSCAAGTWIFIWKMAFLTSGTATHSYTAKLWDGTTVWDESNMGTLGNNNNGWPIVVGGSAYVVLGSTTTVKISGADTRVTNVIQRDVPDNSASSHTYTKLAGIKIA